MPMCAECRAGENEVEATVNALAAVRGASIDAMRNLSRVESDPIRGHDQLCLTVHRLASALATILDTATTAGKE